MNTNNEPNTGVFPFIQDTFIPGKKDKEYILKISSNDTLLKLFIINIQILHI